MSFNEYYLNQAGSGIATYSGYRYQKGHGFFGRMIKGSILPLIKKVLPYLKDQVIDTGREFGRNILTSDNFKQAATRTAKRKLGDIATDALERVKSMTQEGSGFNTCGIPLNKRPRKSFKKSTLKRMKVKRRTTKRLTKRGPKRAKKKSSKKKRTVYKRKTIDMAYVRSFRGKGKKARSNKPKHSENF